MNLNSVLSLIRTPKSTIADVESALAALSVDGARSAVEKLDAARNLALVIGDETDLAALDDQIKLARVTVERVMAMRKELEARLVALRAEEAERNLEESAKRMRKMKDGGKTTCRELHTLLSNLSPMIGTIHATEAAIIEHNKKATAAGRKDLVIPTIADDVFQVRIEKFQAYHMERTGQIPSNGIYMEPLIDPQLSIRSYFPATRFDPGKEDYMGSPLKLV